MIKYSFLFLSFLSSCSSLKCNDFKKGHFIVPSDSENTKPYTIIRDHNSQIEIDSEGVKRYSKIEWLNDCTYILRYDDSKMELTEFQKEVNKKGGIVVQVVNVDNNCFNYTSKIKSAPDNEKINGVLCKK